MSTVELDERAMEAARREAERRGVDVSEVVSAAVQRFVAGGDLQELLAEFRRRDEASDDALTEEEALRIANEELDAFRAARS
jgi:enoyl-CoA hydratase/carnithine racemase